MTPQGGIFGLPQLPAEHRGRLLSGMRWTVWLAALAMPFSALTTLVLGRISPAVLGTYGTLSVYVSFVGSFLFFGGETVVIHYIPACRGVERLRFAFTYLAITVASCLVWLVAATLFPPLIQDLVGHQNRAGFDLWLILLAPIQISFALIVASLKGMLELKWVQALNRSITILTALTYTLLAFFARSFLSGHYSLLIWLVYFLCTLLLAAFGLVRLLRLHAGDLRHAFRFFLPAGFWRYASATQQVSMTSFLMTRLDYILILNWAGVERLGQYVMVVTIAGVIGQINLLLLDSLFPSISNLVSAGNRAAAHDTLRMHLRVALAAEAAAAILIVCLAGQMGVFLGPRYSAVGSLIAVGTCFWALYSPLTTGGTLLAAVGRQRVASWIGLVQIAVFAALFVPLWRSFGLLGAVIATGAGALASNGALWLIAQRITGIRGGVGREYGSLAVCVISTTAIVLYRPNATLGLDLVLALAGIAAFFALAGYSRQDAAAILKQFLPSRNAKTWFLRRSAAVDPEPIPNPVEIGEGVIFHGK